MLGKFRALLRNKTYNTILFWITMALLVWQYFRRH